MQDVLEKTEKKMKQVIVNTKNEFATIRTGRASVGLLDKIEVDYYGTKVPLKQLATVTTPEPRVLAVEPYDKGSIDAIKKAIMTSDLGIIPSDDGRVIRITIPRLTEERRKELVKLVSKEAEARRVTIRAYRREANEELKALEKSGELPEDMSKKQQKKIQDLTDEYIKKIDELLEKKKEEIMEV